ncbi:MAG: hypothetical protein ABIX37_11435 [Gammaproteobacteria bacterium]
MLLPLLAGCDQALIVPTTFPEPVVEPLPLDVALYFTDEFANYHYREDVAGDSKWDIELGKANVALFESVSRRLFRSATRVSARPTGSGAAAFNVIIEPTIAAFEFSLPSQSATDQYSVWIRYTVKAYRPDGEELKSWNISAYGESDATLLRPARSMEHATILALRDAAATLTVNFADEARARGVMPMEKADAASPPAPPSTPVN